jgi:hypothetical protein
MRQLLISSAVLFISVAAAAQVTAVSGYASNWTPAPGLYAGPFVPLVTTPSVTLETGVPTQVGASNATDGLVAGATIVPIPAAAARTLPTAYGAGEAQPQSEANEQLRRSRFEFGVAKFEDDQGVAQLVSTGKHLQIARTYTNADVDQLNQRNGTVQFEGKTERLD